MVFYRTVMVDGLSIFYREAGRPDAPTLLLLHGFPSSSRMYEPLLTRLSAYYHLVASAICPGRRSISSMPATLRSTRSQTRSQSWLEIFWDARSVNQQSSTMTATVSASASAVAHSANG
jgi:pimeloyl-ACP methyl ester carboxylesterase